MDKNKPMIPAAKNESPGKWSKNRLPGWGLVGIVILLCIAAGIVTMPVTGFYLLGGILFIATCLVLFLNPTWGIYWLAFLLPTDEFQVLPGIGLTLGKILAPVIFIVLILRNIQSLKQLSWPKTVTLPYVIFTGWCFLSVIAGPKIETGITPLKSLVFYLVLMFFTYNLIDTREKLIKTINIFIIAVSLVSLYTVLGYLGITPGRFMYGDMNQVRIIGSFDDPNKFGLILLISFSLILVQLYNHWTTRGKYLFILAGLLVLVSIILTFSRSTWLNGLLIVALFPFLSKRYRLWVYGGIAVVLLVIIFWGNISYRIQMGTKVKDLSVTDRLVTNRAAIQLWKDNPILGVGLQNSFEAIQPYKKLQSGYATEATEIHNLYLKLLTETGLIGLLLFLYLEFSILRMAWNIRKSAHEPETRMLSNGFVMLYCVFLLQNLFVSFIYISLYWYLVALGAVFYRLIETPLSIEASKECHGD